MIADRRKQMPAGSYTASLFASGGDRIAQKVGEEAVEIIIAAKNKNRTRIISEVADLWFHVLVLLVSKNIRIREIEEELESRRKTISDIPD